MKTMFTGSRDLIDYQDVVDSFNSTPWTITELIEGEARGGDRWAKAIAIQRSIPIIPIPAIWNKVDAKGIATVDRSAGFLRNAKMIEQAEACLYTWNGWSSGTASAILLAIERNLPIHGKVTRVNHGIDQTLTEFDTSKYRLVTKSNEDSAFHFYDNDYPLYTRHHGAVCYANIYNYGLYGGDSRLLTWMLNSSKPIPSFIYKKQANALRVVNQYLTATNSIPRHDAMVKQLLQLKLYQHYDRLNVIYTNRAKHKDEVRPLLLMDRQELILMSVPNQLGTKAYGQNMIGAYWDELFNQYTDRNLLKVDLEGVNDVWDGLIFKL